MKFYFFLSGVLAVFCIEIAKAFSKVQKYEDLKFYSIFDENSGKIKNIKAFIGGFHHIKIKPGNVPFIYIFLDFKNEKAFQIAKELESYSKVNVTVLKKNDAVKKIQEFKKNNDNLIYISNNYTFDFFSKKYKDTNWTVSSNVYKSIFNEAQTDIVNIFSTKKRLLDKNNNTILEVLTNETKKNDKIENYELSLLSKVPNEVECSNDVIEEFIIKGATPYDINEFKVIKQKLKKIKKTKIAVAIPTTSKAMRRKEEIPFLRDFIPSLSKTLTSEELEKNSFAIFIGFDEGDKYFEKRQNIQYIKDKIKSYFNVPIFVIFVRLYKINRVAQTWNMIFSLARKMMPFDYYFQVNDDLTLLTKGWLNVFISNLKKNHDFGVVGHSDIYHNFNCTLLTQAFVSEKHFKIFDGLYYPIDFNNWKSDRWLSTVYGHENTFCWTNITAKNGGKATRYSPCDFRSWKLSLERSKAQISYYVKNQKE